MLCLKNSEVSENPSVILNDYKFMDECWTKSTFEQQQNVAVTLLENVKMIPNCNPYAQVWQLTDTSIVFLTSFELTNCTLPSS